MNQEQKRLFLEYCDNLYAFMKKHEWYGACHATTAMIYVFAKKLGIDCLPCIGECKQEGYKPFDHSWLLIDGSINDIAIAMPFELNMAKGPVYDSIDTRTGKIVDMDYGIKFLGLGPQAELAYSKNLYDYLKESPEVNLINIVIELSKLSKVYITRRWMEQNLSSERFALIAK